MSRSIRVPYRLLVDNFTAYPLKRIEDAQAEDLPVARNGFTTEQVSNYPDGYFQSREAGNSTAAASPTSP